MKMKPFVITTKFTSRETTSFKQYLKDISDIDIFDTAEDELICAKKAVNGDKKAMDELIQRNLRFVVSVAKKYQSENNPLEDLVNEGNLGLIKAAQKFDPNKGFKFISFAVWYIRKNLTEYVTRGNRLIKLPLNKVIDINAYNRKLDALEQKFGRNVDVNELLTEYKKGEITKEEIEILEDLNLTKIWSLDKTIGDEDMKLYDVIEDTTFPKTDHLLINNLFKEQIQDLLSTLKPKEIDIINKLYGLNGHTPKNFSEIGKEYGVSREYIRQISVASLNKLKATVKDYNLTF